MRPIDKIRESINPDLLKYHSTALFQIRSREDVKDMKGVGLCATVYPLNKYNASDVKSMGTTASGKDTSTQGYKVHITNITSGRIAKDFHKKHLIMTLNPVKDSSEIALGIAVPMSVYVEDSLWKDDAKIKQPDGSTVSIILSQKESIQIAKYH